MLSPALKNRQDNGEGERAEPFSQQNAPFPGPPVPSLDLEYRNAPLCAQSAEYLVERRRRQARKQRRITRQWVIIFTFSSSFSLDPARLQAHTLLSSTLCNCEPTKTTTGHASRPRGPSARRRSPCSRASAATATLCTRGGRAVFPLLQLQLLPPLPLPPFPRSSSRGSSRPLCSRGWSARRYPGRSTCRSRCGFALLSDRERGSTLRYQCCRRGFCPLAE